MKKRVIVGMSGGVDSAVAAACLKEQGFEVIGLFMKNWEEKDDFGVCQSSKEFEDVKLVCEKLDIPYYSIEFIDEYKTQVFDYFLEELKKGRTPNPDILCNREIKFKAFFDKALSYGADYIATGHYCQKELVNGEYNLLKGFDKNKDQSYFLYTIKSKILEKVLFPVGHLEKKQVREIAHKYDFSVKDKKDSTGICFIGERNFKKFISEYIQYSIGDIEDTNGKVVGKHSGVVYYTIGQRKGLGIGGPGQAWFVVKKDLARNVLIVAQGEDHPDLYSKSLTASELSFVRDDFSINFPYKCKCKVRYRQSDQDCIIEKIENSKVFVSFPIDQRAVTSGQSIVFYNDSICLGGGIID